MQEEITIWFKRHFILQSCLKMGIARDSYGR